MAVYRPEAAVTYVKSRNLDPNQYQEQIKKAYDELQKDLHDHGKGNAAEMENNLLRIVNDVDKVVNSYLPQDPNDAVNDDNQPNEAAVNVVDKANDAEPSTVPVGMLTKIEAGFDKKFGKIDDKQKWMDVIFPHASTSRRHCRRFCQDEGSGRCARLLRHHHFDP